MYSQQFHEMFTFTHEFVLHRFLGCIQKRKYVLIQFLFYAGFETLHYTADMGDPATDEDVRCLCLESEACMPKNVYNAGPCLNVPIRISLPHLYNSDSRYYELIDGLNPDAVSAERYHDLSKLDGAYLCRRDIG